MRDEPARALAADLRRVVGGEVRFDAGTRALYATDASNYRRVPIGVVVPRDLGDLEATVSVVRAHDAPLLVRGAGTSLAGQACNVAVVVDTSRHLGRVLAVDPDARRVRVEPGAVLDHVQAAVAPFGLAVGPDPATHAACTVGGMVGNNACGVHSLTAGRTADNVERLEVLTYDGARFEVGPVSEAELPRLVAAGDRRAEIHRRLLALRDRAADLVRRRYPPIPRRVSGYNLDELLPERGFHVARSLVGSEGTLAVVLSVTLRLVERPPARALAVLGFPDIAAAADRVEEVRAVGPDGLEGIDDALVARARRSGAHARALSLLPEGGGWLLVELGGATPTEAAARASPLARLPGVEARIIADPADVRALWRMREAALGLTAHAPGEPPAWPGWEDAAVPPARLGPYLREFRALLARHGLRGALYGHFGDGCVHTRIDFDLASGSGVERFRSFLLEAAGLVLAHGGSLSGEHGDGRARSFLLERMFGPELVQAFRELKAVWDPRGRMNPGVIVDPAPPEANLRLAAPRAPAPAIAFRLASDGGSLARAALRCVGVGACRRTAGGVMCPSFRATLDERHATRGRARLLDEMLRGDLVRGGWRSREVREALDLCLACKACKAECPTGVDMAAYKAEFLARHYRRRLRPRSSYLFGLVHEWARLGALAPGLANALASSRALRRAAGLAPDRPLPRLAPVSFRRWFRGRSRARWGPGSPAGPAPESPAQAGDAPAGRRVLLWVDTFTDRFAPEVGRAAVELLEGLGYRVHLPPGDLCCGRPLYEAGMLRRARRRLERILDRLGAQIRARTPLVVLEPSCAAVFRDELLELLGDREHTRALAEATLTLAELLDRDGLPAARPTGAAGRAALQVHCHQRAVIGAEADARVLARAGYQVEVLDAGCCGLAGGFGYERRRAPVALAIGERGIVPALRAVAAEALVVADGFSCRAQVEHLTGRRAVHLAEALRRAGLP
jgi:FAD/FMN-containing dehydrogenase/Fe-S oxidoreductase